MPFNVASKPSDGPDSEISNALPFGIPSAISNKITSPSSFIDARCANVPPICPAPIRAILDLAIENSVFTNKKSQEGVDFLINFRKATAKRVQFNFETKFGNFIFTKAFRDFTRSGHKFK